MRTYKIEFHSIFYLPFCSCACASPQIVPKAANDMMDVGRLQKFAGSITAQGKLLLHGPLMCMEGVSNIDRNSSVATKPRELQVFLFEQSIIFSDIIGKKTQFTNPSYIYKNQIQVRYTFLFLCFRTTKHRAKSRFSVELVHKYIYFHSISLPLLARR